MTELGFAVFDTTLGPCGVAWSPLGVIGAQLPMSSAEASRARLKQRFPGAEEAVPPPAIAAGVEAVIALFRGEKADLSTIPLDLSAATDFQRRVYEIILAVPPGETLTYGEIAERLGDKNEARAVGEALGKNPIPIIVPCHRVLAAGGKIGGFTAPGGVDTKRKLLAIESVHAKREADLFG